MKYQAPRGMSDRLPADQPVWRWIETTAAEVATLYGFRRIDTPVLEATGLFQRSVGDGTDIVDKEMYSFDDRGGESLTLRPEGTAPVVRAFLQHGMQSLPQPVKLWYFTSIFRYDRPQKGRYRQHHQFGCEAFGVASPDMDVEMIALLADFYRRLGLLDVRLVINSIGSAESRARYVGQLRAYLDPLRGELSADSQRRLERNPLRVLDSKDAADQRAVAEAPRILDALDDADAAHFAAVQAGLDQLGIAYRVDHRLVRGLDYYVRTVFEFQPASVGGQSTLGGGGRYDPLIELLDGPATPGIGFGTGIERLIAQLADENVPPPVDGRAPVYIAWLRSAAEAARAVGAELRSAGIPTVVALGERSLKAQLKHAAQLGASHAVILAEDEVAAGTVQLRNLTDSSQQVLPRDSLLTALR